MCFLSCYFKELNLFDTRGSNSTLDSRTDSIFLAIFGKEVENLVLSFADRFCFLLPASIDSCCFEAARLLFELLERSAKLIALASCC